MEKPSRAIPSKTDGAQNRLQAARDRVQAAMAELHSALVEMAVAVGNAGAGFRTSACPSDNRMTYRVAEVAKAFGVSDDLVMKRINAGELRAVHMGGALLIRRADLEAYLGQLS